MLAIIRAKKTIVIGVAVLIVAAAIIVGFVLSPDKDAPVEAGQNVVLTVIANAAEDMYGYQLEVHFDDEELEYVGSLKSHIEPIEMIFRSPLDMDGYVLIGATMIGDKEGVNGKNMEVCEMVFTSLQDCMLSDFAISLERINLVKSDAEYIEDIEGWRYKLAVADLEEE